MDPSTILASLKVPPNYNVEEVVEKEFTRLKGQHYLDNAAAALYSEGQVQEVMRELSRSLLGNPHSRHAPSDASTQNIEATRHRILEYFNTTAEEYDLIFTSGATAALRLIGEYFDWNCGKPLGENTTEPRSSKEETANQIDKAQHYKQNISEVKESHRGAFVYLQENHTSVLGMKECAHETGCDVYCLTTTEAIDLLKEDSKGPSMTSCSGTYSHASQNEKSQGQTKRRNCLFAYSPQCNFTGSKAPLEWIKRVHDGALDGLLPTPPMNREQASWSSSSADRGYPEDPTWYVVLDAAGLVATSPLDLTCWKPDFVPVSFYKIFGYPSGLGCLLVRRRAWGLLRKTYLGGGTVLMADSRRMATVPRPVLHERFEDGTQAFLSIPMLRHGLDAIQRLTGSIHNIQSHVYHLARYTHHTLRSMRHACGTPVVQMYVAPGDTWLPSTHGSIVNFNIKNPDGSYVGYAQVERVASLYNIHLHTGCVCNPGACQAYLGITPDKLLQQFKAGHVCGDALDLVDGEPTGAVRISFGYSSTYKDADQLLRMVRECFVEEPMTFDLTWMRKEVDLSWLTREKKEGGTEGVNQTGEEKKADVMGDGGTKPVNETKEEWRRVQVLYKGDINEVTNDNSNDNDSNNNNNNNNLENSLPTVQNYRNTASPSLPTTPHPVTSHSTSLVSKPCPPASSSTHRLTDIVVYPVKSCRGVRMESWEVGRAGLWLDHCWMVVTGGGATLTQKRLPHMALISPRFDLEHGEMVLSYEGEAEELRIPLNPTEPLDTSGVALCGGRVCGVRVQGLDCGDVAGDWLSRMLGMPDLRMMMQTTYRPGKLGGGSGASGESMSLANESQYLIIHRPSVRNLLREINSRGLEELTEDELVERFRGNLVVDGGGKAYEEDSWDTVTINGTTLQVQSCCRRCQMVCVVPSSGQRTREPMLSLSAARGPSMLFGVHATAPPLSVKKKRKLCVGAVVEVTMK